MLNTKETILVDLDYLKYNPDKDYTIDLEDFADRISGSWLSDDEKTHILLKLEDMAKSGKYPIGKIVLNGNELIQMINDFALENVNLPFTCEVDNLVSIYTLFTDKERLLDYIDDDYDDE